MLNNFESSATENLSLSNETIVASATASGRAGVGIVRVSGPLARKIAIKVVKTSLKPRYAHYLPFYDSEDRVIDEGLAIFFPAPNSFTGEDVLELQGHGGSVVMNMLIQTINHLGVRLARPGEFSERAFLNDKMDLSQAEAVADLINSTSEQAARNAVRSMQGVFSQKIHELVESLTQLRVYVEASIDFPEEEIDFLADGKVARDLKLILSQLKSILRTATQGVLLREGMTVVIAGKPNAGKSSLLNMLAERETAIVTDIEGTTRDIIREDIHIDGLPLHIVDTAGLRESVDKVEKIGIERALKAISEADQVLLVVDGSSMNDIDLTDIWPDFVDNKPPNDKITIIINKIDLTGDKAGIDNTGLHSVVSICAKTGLGIDCLKKHLKQCLGFDDVSENSFSARRRHIQALEKAQLYTEKGLEQLIEIGAGELLAEDLKTAQRMLSEITGELTNDELLGRIFSSFCIGK